MSSLADLLNPEPSSSAGAGANGELPPSPPLHRDRPSSRPTPISTSVASGQQSHRRNESITSPLEALAIAATSNSTERKMSGSGEGGNGGGGGGADVNGSNSNNSSSNAQVTQSKSAVASSPPTHPPNPYLNTNPYAIKQPQQSPPAARPASRPSMTDKQSPAPAEATVNVPSSPSHTVKSPAPSAPPPPPPDAANSSGTPQDSLLGSTQPKVVKTEMSDEAAIKSTLAPEAPPVKAEDAPTVSNKSGHDGGDVDMKDNSLPAETKLSSGPKKAVAATKKGTAKATSGGKRPAAKKRKLEPESKDGTPFSQRSGTPNSRSSKTPAMKRSPQQSPAPQASLPATNNDEEEESEMGSEEEDGEVFCICRRPDDHTWMIACDGGCDDWFHGACVRVDEADGNLIDKYICPNCEKAGRGKTMWKPMCRLPGCREPARVTGKKPSKYCSDQHGRQFMAEMAAGKAGKSHSDNSRGDDGRKRRKANKTEQRDDDVALAAALKGDDSDDGHQAHLRGGVLKPGEVKALTNGLKKVEEFKRLGEPISAHNTTNGNGGAAAAAAAAAVTPEKQANDTDGDVKMEEGDAGDDVDADADAGPAPKLLQFTEQEQKALDWAGKKREELNARLAMLADRDKLLTMVKARHKSTLEELRKKDKSVKDICGYDSRLTWSDEEFNRWRADEEGKAALSSNTLPPPPKRKPEETNGSGGAAGNGVADEEEEEVGRGVCKKKRCERHKTWAKLEQQEINLSRSQCWHEMRRIDRDEEDLKDRALMRQREAR